AAALAAAGSQLTLAGPLPALVAFGEAAMVAERDARLTTGLSLFAAPVPVPVGLLGGVAAADVRGPQPLPLAVVGPDLQTKVLDHFARQLAFDDLDAFQKKMTELGKSKDTAPARDYLDAFVK